MNHKQKLHEWTTETDKEGNFFLVLDDNHRWIVGDLEDTCIDCHDYAEMAASAPRMYNALLNIAQNMSGEAQEYAAGVIEALFPGRWQDDEPNTSWLALPMGAE